MRHIKGEEILFELIRDSLHKDIVTCICLNHRYPGLRQHVPKPKKFKNILICTDEGERELYRLAGAEFTRLIMVDVEMFSLADNYLRTRLRGRQGKMQLEIHYITT